MHHDLGLGGAERLVVEAALACASLGHDTTIHTARWDPDASFAETRTGAFRVAVHRPILPPAIGGRLRAPLTHARLAALARAARADGPHDLYFLDGVPTAAPYLRRTTNARVAYYCHFPDLLLAPPGGPLLRAYRRPIDAFERACIRAAHHVFANSAYTRGRMHEEFGALDAPVEVLPPPVRPMALPEGVRREPPTVLALHRFDLAKNILLAVEAFARLAGDLPGARLVVAGGFDPRFPADREALEAVRSLAVARGLADRIELVTNPSDEAVLALYARCRCVTYTPVAEHFGIVPVEAMAAGVPVVAVDAAGPRETIVQGETGLLVPPTAEAFAGAMRRILTDDVFAARLGEAGRARARRFSREAFRARLGALIEGLHG